MFFIDWSSWSSIRKVGINNQEKVKRLLLIRSFVMILWSVLLVSVDYFLTNDNDIWMTILFTCYVCFHVIVSRLISRYMYKDPTIVFNGDNHKIFNAQVTLIWINMFCDFLYLVGYLSFLYYTFVDKKKKNNTAIGGA